MYENCKEITVFLQYKRAKTILIDLFKELFQIKLNDISFKEVETFKGIAEYEFYLVNLEGIDSNNLKQDLFIKIIKKGKIKESIFCICDLAYEKYFNDVESKENMKKNKKITILEENRSIKNVNKVSINLFENNFKKERFNLEINFIKISNIIEKNGNEKGGTEYIDLNLDDMLLIGRKNSIRN